MIRLTREASIIVGDREQIIAELKQSLPPSTFYFEFVNFGIEESRLFKERGARRLGEGERQFWVLTLAAITLEAQNALLKTLEEPALGHHFVFAVSAVTDLLPTLLSRCEIINFEHHLGDSPPPFKDIKKFLSADIEDRLSFIQKLLKEHEGFPALARQAALKLVNGMEEVLHQEGVTPENRPYFAELIRARDYLHDRAAMPRLILEHLALVLLQV